MRTQNVKPPLLAIVGPTASAKSAMALKLAKKFKGVILSADPQQMYRGAKIGTNQPAGKWLIAGSKWQKISRGNKLYLVQGVPHFFIDMLSPNKQYSAAQFQADVTKLCPKLFTLGYLPILVGGSGLYVSAIVENYNFPKINTKAGLRKKLEKMSLTELKAKLKRLDPMTYKRIDRHNKRRLVRALEYVLASGKSFFVARSKQLRPNTLTLGIDNDKKDLRTAIERRTAKMFKRGLVTEVKEIKRRYPHSPLLQSIGYREVIDHLNNKITRQQAEEQINAHTWQYARRQLTWFKRRPYIDWITSAQQALRLVHTYHHLI